MASGWPSAWGVVARLAILVSTVAIAWVPAQVSVTCLPVAPVTTSVVLGAGLALVWVPSTERTKGPRASTPEGRGRGRRRWRRRGTPSAGPYVPTHGQARYDMPHGPSRLVVSRWAATGLGVGPTSRGDVGAARRARVRRALGGRPALLRRPSVATHSVGSDQTAPAARANTGSAGAHRAL